MTTVNINCAGDNLIRSSTSSALNFGGYVQLWLYPAQRSSLLRFVLSSIPAGAIITSATLNLYNTANTTIDSTVSLFQISDANGDWIEGTSVATTAKAGESCWNAKVADGSGGVTTAWAGTVGLTTAGTDYIDTVLASLLVASGTSANTKNEIPFNEDGLAVLQSWFGDATNNGFIVRSVGSTIGTYHSKEATTEGYRPVLTIVYEAAATALTAADLTLSPVTFDAPTLTNVSSTEDLTAKDFTLSAVTFDKPTLEITWNTPACRSLTIASESRVLSIEGESRVLSIESEMRGLKIECHSESKYEITRLTYNGLTGKDLTLNAVTFDAPYLINGELVPEPDSAFDFAPFYVIDDGDRTFTLYSKTVPSSLFNLQTYAGIAVTKTYYVDKATGDDGNSGADWDNALATVRAACIKSDVDRVYVKDGYYYFNEVYGAFNLTSSRNIEIIGVTDNVFLTCDIANVLSSWTSTDNYYSATTPSGSYANATKAWDKTNLQPNGVYTPLALKTSVAEVNATANSFYAVSNGGGSYTIYVHTFDGREPDSNTILLNGYSLNIYTDAYDPTYYFKNIQFVGKVNISTSTAGANRGHTYFENCTLHNGIRAYRSAEVILRSCSGWAVDNDIVEVSGGLGTPNFIEIDCDFALNISGGDNQASTTHTSKIIRIGGNYHDISDQGIADALDGYCWLVGVHIYDCGVGLYADVVGAWLDTCTIETCTTGISNNAGNACYTYELINACPNSIDGTLTTYTR